jgi:hypothetical protein
MIIEDADDTASSRINSESEEESADEKLWLEFTSQGIERE